MTRATARSTHLLAFVLAWTASPVFAQQRPLVTEDPETVGAGRMLLEAGLDYERDVFFPLSGLSGDLLSVPNLGLSIGVSSIAEIQIDGGLYQRLTIKDQVRAPLTPILEIDGDRTSTIKDLLVGAKIRLLGEAPGRPALGVRFSTRLPNASNESGLGRETTDFTAAFLIGKTVQSVRLVGNFGFLMLEDPVRPAEQDELLTYNASVARAVAEGFEVVGEVQGRTNLAEVPSVGAENRGVARIGLRFTEGSVRVDGALQLGLTPRDPDFGFTAGFTWVFNAFQVP